MIIEIMITKIIIVVFITGTRPDIGHFRAILNSFKDFCHHIPVQHYLVSILDFANGSGIFCLFGFHH